MVLAFKHLWLQLRDHLEMICLAVSVFFSPIGGVFLAVGSFIMLDTFFGWWAASRMPDKKTSSKALRKGLIPKSIAYLALICAFFIAERYLTNMYLDHKYHFLVTRFIAFILIVVELISVDEKWRVVKGESLLIVFRRALKVLRQLLKDIRFLNSPDKEG